MAAKFKTDSRRWLTLDYRPLKLEQEIQEFWENNNVLQKLTEYKQENNAGLLGYVEGPPTLNGVQHIGHARGRVIKDFRYRLKTMQGFYVTFWGGWDTQGLPIELEVERELGVKNKKELLERIGEEQFVEECKKTVMKYHRQWFEADKKLGLFINYDKAYWTHYDRYIEREWHYLERAWEQKLLGEGYYVVAYCPHCQTSLSNAEVGLGYEEVEDPSLHFKFRLSETENEYFPIWTTMPFTIITDMMLAVHPEEEYAKVKVDTEIWILAKQRIEPIIEELGTRRYEILEVVKGKDLHGTKYEYPFKDIVPKQKELDRLPVVHTVVCEDFVDVATATGIVHLSPGNGEDDFLAAQKRHLPMYAPFNDECRFTEEAGEFAGLFVRDADEKVVDELRKRGLLLSVKTVSHEYPTCWRSHHKLVWLARREYFLWTNRINDNVVKAARKVDYFYEGPKNRFLAFLKEGKPWCISRERVWGTPLPIWVCEKCGSKTLVASKKELFEKALKLPGKNFELHKPWIDLVTLKCEDCDGKMKREPFVLDCWHDSGASPYASFTDDEFRKFVPVDFLTEAIDQTRGWANSLLLEHVILTGKPEAPYEAFLFQGFVLDAKGRKMSKSLGNVIEVNPLLQERSADVSRFYLLWKCSPIESMNFDAEELKGRPYQVLSTLYHLHKFFMQNAEYDRFDPRKHTLQWAKHNKALKTPDRWLLSKLQHLMKEVTEKAETCEFHFALSELEDFVVNVLSRNYVPMIRKDLWSDDPETLNRRLAVYSTLWHALRILVLLFNPTTPFLSEAMHQKVYRELDNTLPETVSFESWPVPDKAYEDKVLEEEFEILLRYLPLVYSARQAARLKRRWPLGKVVVVAPRNVQKALHNLEKLFLELSNVKKAEYREKLPEADLNRWALTSDVELHVLLDTQRDEGLEGEGLMRDLARRVQALRKELGFTPTDKLNAVHIAELDSKSEELLEPHLVEMAQLVRAKKVHVQEKRGEVKAEWRERRVDNKKIYVALL
ncbi:MAG: isoleucine--tRNA ligase [Candidatus Bathyarchaeota archaeon]|nr:isoleucine--tRNA ligase [Candidatus Bathyarchaeota archaeon]